jgi:hypothetical protein
MADNQNDESKCSKCGSKDVYIKIIYRFLCKSCFLKELKGGKRG